MTALHYTRNLAGIIIKDLRHYRRALHRRDATYLGLCNRTERLERAPTGEGYRCNWQWTSDLHAPRYLPNLGLRLMKRAIGDHPICRVAFPEKVADIPDVSFVVAHRGLDRLPNLLVSLECIAGQQGPKVECVVVEQDVEARIEKLLPAWVRYIHTPTASYETPFCKAWAFNVGSRLARGKLLILHDSDMLVPRDFASHNLARAEEGYEVVDLKRFIFFLSQDHSERVIAGEDRLFDQPPQSIMQNAPGGSLAIMRDAYSAIGGFDESFIGWGGEDNEFWERAQTLRVWPYGYMPLIHLWHNPQPGKLETDRLTAALLQAKSAIPPETRIVELTAREADDSHFDVASRDLTGSPSEPGTVSQV